MLDFCAFIETKERNVQLVVSFVCVSYVPHLFPNYLRAPNGAEAKPVTQLYKGQTAPTNSENNVQMTDYNICYI